MIYPWKVAKNVELSSGVLAYFEIDNRKCEKEKGVECFPTANEAAEYLAAAQANRLLPESFPIYRVRGVPSNAEVPSAAADQPQNTKLVVCGVVIVVFLGVLMGVLVKAQRRKAEGVTWFPEGFKRNHRYGAVAVRRKIRV
jgi:Notch-like protein